MKAPARCLISSMHAGRDIEQQSNCDCAHCHGDCDCTRAPVRPRRLDPPAVRRRPAFPAARAGSAIFDALGMRSASASRVEVGRCPCGVMTAADCAGECGVPAQRRAASAAGFAEVGRAVRLEAFFLYMVRSGLLLDRWDFIDLGMDRAADFLAAWLEPDGEIEAIEL